MNAAWDGLPQTPERDGWHWLSGCDGYEWAAMWRATDFRGPGGWLFVGTRVLCPPTVITGGYRYLAPCLTPAAQDARVAELLAANNREVERRRKAEAEAARKDAALREIEPHLGHGRDPSGATTWGEIVRAALAKEPDA